MARTHLPQTRVLDGQAAAGDFDAIDQAQGMYVNLEGQRVGVVLVVRNTAGSEKDLTVSASDGTGDLVVAVPATTGERFVYIRDAARFMQSPGDGGRLHLDFESGMTGTVAAVVPGQTFLGPAV